MKTILLIAILLGFLAPGAFAQDTYSQYIDCNQPHVAGTCPGDMPSPNIRLVPADNFHNSQISCADYANGTSFVSACPDSSDYSGIVQFTLEGNYPMSCTSHQRLDGTVVVICHPKCVLMEDPATGRQWYKCPED